MHLAWCGSPCYDRKKKCASKEMAFPYACINSMTNKSLFLGENKREMSARGPLNAGNSRSRLQSSPKNIVERNGCNTYTRKLRYLLPVAMNLSPFMERSTGMTLTCIMRFIRANNYQILNSYTCAKTSCEKKAFDALLRQYLLRHDENMRTMTLMSAQ